MQSLVRMNRQKDKMTLDTCTLCTNTFYANNVVREDNYAFTLSYSCCPIN